MKKRFTLAFACLAISLLGPAPCNAQTFSGDAQLWVRGEIRDDENLNGGTHYVNGGQPYKSMTLLWYHADPLPWLGASLIGMNLGMQSLVTGWSSP